MANVIDVVVNGKNNASAPLKQVSKDVDGVANSVKRANPIFVSSFAKVVQWGDAWGTAAGKLGGAGGAGGITGTVEKMSTGMLRLASSFGPVIGAGAVLIGFLQNISEEMGKTISEISRLSTGIETGLTNAIKSVAVIQAQASGDKLRIIEATTDKELTLAEQVKKARVQKAQEELDQTSGLWAVASGQRMAAEAKFTAEVAAAEADLANKTYLIHVDKNVKLEALEKTRLEMVKTLHKAAADAEADAVQAVLLGQGKQLEAMRAGQERKRALLDETYQKELESIEKLLGATQRGHEARVAAEEQYQSRVVEMEADAAAKRTQIIEQFTERAAGIVKKLGEDFSGLSDKLNVAKFVQNTREQIIVLQQLQEAVRSGDQTLIQSGVSVGGLGEAINKLKGSMQEAINTGIVPTTEKLKEAKQAADEFAGSGQSAGEKWLSSIEGISSSLDAIIAKTRAASAAAAGAGSTATGMRGSTAATSGDGGGSSSGRLIEPYHGMGEWAPSGPGTSLAFTPGERSGTGGGGMGGPGAKSDTSGARTYDPNQTYQHGGVVPVLAHAGEIIDQPRRIVDRLSEAVRQVDRGRGGRKTAGQASGGVHVHVAPGAVNYQGGFITSADRDFESITELMAQRIGERMRR